MLADGGRAEALEVAPDAVLLLDGELAVGEALEEVDDVDGGDVARVVLRAVDARYDAVRLAELVLRDGLARDDEAAAVLDLGEADEAAAGARPPRASSRCRWRRVA